MYNIRKKFKFEYAHQLINAYSDCCKDCIHGHSAVLEVFISASTLDKNEMVLDFGELKERINSLISEYDHALVMSNKHDPEYLKMLKKFNSKLIIVDYNSTAENMAKDFYYRIEKLLNFKLFKNDLKLWKIRLHETDTGYAEYKETK